jgi:hypothetical protein
VSDIVVILVGVLAATLAACGWQRAHTPAQQPPVPPLALTVQCISKYGTQVMGTQALCLTYETLTVYQLVVPRTNCTHYRLTVCLNYTSQVFAYLM